VEEIFVKLAAGRAASSPTFAWRLYIPNVLIETHPTLPPRSRMVCIDGVVYIEFGEIGVRHTRTEGLYHSSVYSARSTVDMAMPHETLKAELVAAEFDSDRNVIRLNPATYSDTVLQAIGVSAEDRDSTVIERRLALPVPKGANITKSLTVRPKEMPPVRSFQEVASEQVEPSGPPVVPHKVNMWTDTNLRALQQLIKDCQLQCPDVVFQVVNGVVVMKRQRLEDI
jgi:hypothetical protein